MEALNSREQEILHLLADGLSDREIADKLVLSLGTVKWYNRQIYSKLGVSSRTQAAALARSSAPIEHEPPTPARHPLPSPVTSFIGREREVREVAHLIQTSRLITLTGPGGIGKTRLALEVASRNSDTFEDSVVFASLAPLVDPTLVASELLNCFGLSAQTVQAQEVLLRRYVRDKHMLLVIDNFEHLLPAAPLLSDLLASGPQLKIMVTSREMLHLYGEVVYTLPPLAVTVDQDDVVPDHQLIPAALRLFLERARSARRDFAVDAEVADVARELCTYLEGIPLAIELAAAQARVLGPGLLFQRLEGRLGLPGSKLVNVHDRQQTIRSTIDWSYQLLEPAEQRLFMQLAVFRGGWTLEAVEAICSVDEPDQVFDRLVALSDKSMISPPREVHGDLRFTMLETLREFAAERLTESGDSDALHQRHCGYYTAFASHLTQHVRQGNHRLWLRRLTADTDNLRAALSYSVAERDAAENGLRLIEALSLFFIISGYLHEGRRWCEAVIAKTSNVRSVARVRALYQAGYLLYQYADYETAFSWFEKGRLLAESIGDDYGTAQGFHFRSLRFPPGDAEQAIEDGEIALNLFKKLNEPYGAALAHNGLGEIWRMLGENERAIHHYRQAKNLFQELEDEWYMALALSNLGSAYYLSGDHDNARVNLIASLHATIRVGGAGGIVAGMRTVVGVIAHAGQFEQTARLIGASEQLHQLIGYTVEPPDQLDLDVTRAFVQEHIDPDVFQQLMTEGSEWSLEQALAATLAALDARSG